MKPLILCVTPHPALDRTLIVPGFAVGQIFRPAKTVLNAGGKGLNVARSLRILGGNVMAAAPLGGNTGRLVAEIAAKEGMAASWTWCEGETRACTIIVGDGSDSTVLNETTVITVDDWTRFIADVVARGREADVICLSGSVPKGPRDGAPGDLIRAVKALGKPIWVDTSGRSLTLAVDEQPTAIKVNGDEAGELVGQAVSDADSAVEAAQAIRRRGIDVVAITLGRHGAVMVDSKGSYVGQTAPVQIVSAVGSGDAFFAGLVYALSEGHDSATALRYGIAAGTANALFAGGAEFTLDSFERVLAATTVK
jgi:1-phosphofructokinase family hexose kinase